MSTSSRPERGGLTLFPHSHRRIWEHWEAVHRGGPPPEEWDGYTTKPLPDIKAGTDPVETYALLAR